MRIPERSGRGIPVFSLWGAILLVFFILGRITAAQAKPEAEEETKRDVAVRISLRHLSDIPISRFITGSFIEKGFGRQVSGMWAEKIYNRNFLDVPPYRETVRDSLQLRLDLVNPDAPFWHSGYEENDWELIGLAPAARRRSRGRNPFKGSSSLELTNPTAGKTSGLRQRGLFFHRGVACRFELLAGIQGPKTDPLRPGPPSPSSQGPERRPLIVRLIQEADGRLLFVREFELTTVPRLLTAPVDPGEFEGRATLEIIFDWEGTLVLAGASLMPVDNQGGWRRDVLDRLREIAPPVIRYPGGCFTSFFDWRDAVGPRGRRPASESFFWGGLEENDVGMDEFLDLCRRLGSEPQVCINMMTGTPARAAELVEYCNGPDESRMGRLRRENGIVRRSRVRLWEMDNEAGRKWSPLQYARETVRFASAMREADPDIEIMMEYYSWEPALEWLPRMLEIAGGSIQYVGHRSIDPVFYHRALKILRGYNRRHGTRIRHVNTEWVASYDAAEPFSDPELSRTHSWKDVTLDSYKRSRKYRQNRWFYALNAAVTLLDFLSLGGEFHLANFNNCVNTWGQNIIEASKEDAWISPAGLVFRFFRDFEGTFPLETDSSFPPLLRAQACESGTGGVLYLVNLSGGEKIVRLRLPKDLGSTREMETLTAPDRLSRTFPDRSEITAVRMGLSGAKELRIPPLSVNRVTIRK